MKVKLNKEQKIKLLKAIKSGYIDTTDFDEIRGQQVVIFELPDNGRDTKKADNIK